MIGVYEKSATQNNFRPIVFFLIVSLKIGYLFNFAYRRFVFSTTKFISRYSYSEFDFHKVSLLYLKKNYWKIEILKFLTRIKDKLPTPETKKNKCIGMFNLSIPTIYRLDLKYSFSFGKCDSFSGQKSCLKCMLPCQNGP